jgi:hypothetical protein
MEDRGWKMEDGEGGVRRVWYVAGRDDRWVNFWGKTFLRPVPVKAGIPSWIGGWDKPFLGRGPGPDRLGREERLLPAQSTTIALKSLP